MAAFQERPMGFFTDTSICIGCKACEVACKEWNQLEGNKPELLLDSFDNTGQLDAQNWRHVEFIEQIPDNNGVVMTPTPIAGGQAWLMMSDVCKHCQNASCLEVCPTNAIVRTEFDSVLIQQDVCNGCRDCISACPYGVIGFNEKTGTAHKCTLCYDRLQNGMQPACAKASPRCTSSRTRRTRSCRAATTSPAMRAASSPRSWVWSPACSRSARSG